MRQATHTMRSVDGRACRRNVALALVVLYPAACAATPDPAADDAQVSATDVALTPGDASGAGGEPQLVIGGSLDDGSGFVDWSGGAAHALVVTGFQGGQHVWVSLEARNVNPKKAHVVLQLREAGTGQLVPPGASPWWLTLTPEDGWYTHAGITAFIDEPCSVVGLLLTAEATLTDAAGQTVTATAQVTPDWPGMCD